jgi:plasmid maintenance system antidote protein VapI
MYPNLKAEMARRNIFQKDLVKPLDLTLGTVSEKLRGNSEITLTEARIIKETIGTDLPLEVLFDKEAS